MPIDTTKCRSYRSEFVEWLTGYDLQPAAASCEPIVGTVDFVTHLAFCPADLARYWMAVQ